MISEIQHLNIPTFVKQALTPGSLWFLAAGLLLSICIGYISARARTATLLALALFYFLLSNPAVANALGDALAVHATEGTVQRADTLIVLDGDNRRGRVRQFESSHDLLRPLRVIVLGEWWLVQELSKTGIPVHDIQWDAGARNTREQLAWIAHYAVANPKERIAIVVSRLQALRVAGLLRAGRIGAGILASPADAEPPRSGGRVLIPTYAALRVSRDALYELAACSYYRYRGWIS